MAVGKPVHLPYGFDRDQHGTVPWGTRPGQKADYLDLEPFMRLVVGRGAVPVLRGEAVADFQPGGGTHHGLSAFLEEAALDPAVRQVGDEVRDGPDNRRAVVAVAKGDGGGDLHLRVVGDQVVGGAVQKRHVAGLQVDGGHHHRQLGPGRADHHVELRRRPRCADPQPAFLRDQADAHADGGGDQQDEQQVRPAEPPEQRADQREGPEAAQQQHADQQQRQKQRDGYRNVLRQYRQAVP